MNLRQPAVISFLGPLKEAHRKAGSLRQLQHLVEAAAREARVLRSGSSAISRHKLERLLKEDSLEKLALTIREIRCLDAFLSKNHNYSFSKQPLFLCDTITDQMVVEKEVTFLLRGYVTNGNSVSEWDVRSLQEVTEAIYRSGNVTSHVRTIRYDDSEVATHEQARRFWDTEQDQNGAIPAGCVIAIGEPARNVGAEHLLAEMFGLPLFQTNAALKAQHLYFVRPKAACSSFTREAENDQLRELKVKLEGGRPLTFLTNRGHRFDKAYGVIVARRSGNGSLRCVIAGSSAPGTLAAARVLADMRGDVPQRDARKVLVSVVSAALKDESTDTRDFRTLLDPGRFVIESALISI